MAESSLKNGWRSYRFDQMALMINDRIDDPQEASVDRYVGLEHLDPDSLRIRRWGSPSDVTATKLLFRTGDIIFGRRRVYQRKLAVADFDGICSAHAMVLRAKPDVVLPEFLPFFMQSGIFMERAKEISVGSLSPTINWKSLAREEFALPPLNEQRRFAAVLTQVEAAVISVEEAISSALVAWRAMSAAEFRRYSGTGEPLARYFTFAEGQVDPRLDRFADLPLVGPDHIDVGTGGLEVPPSAREQGAVSGKYHFERGTVLYSKIRPELQKAAIAGFDGLSSADIYPLSPGRDLRSEYLLEILLSPSFTRFAVSGSRRSAIPKVNREHLEAFRFSVPPVGKQDEYLDVVGGMRAAIAAFRDRRRALSLLKRVILLRVSNG